MKINEGEKEKTEEYGEFGEMRACIGILILFGRDDEGKGTGPDKRMVAG